MILSFVCIIDIKWEPGNGMTGDRKLTEHVLRYITSMYSFFTLLQEACNTFFYNY